MQNIGTPQWINCKLGVILGSSSVKHILWFHASKKQEETDLNFSLFGRGDLSLDILAPKSFEIHGIQGFHKYHLQAFNKVVGDNLHNPYTREEIYTRNVWSFQASHIEFLRYVNNFGQLASFSKNKLHFL